MQIDMPGSVAFPAGFAKPARYTALLPMTEQQARTRGFPCARGHSAFNSGEIRTMVDMVRLAADDQCRNRLDTRCLGFRDTRLILAEVDVLNIEPRTVERVGHGAFGINTHRASGVVKNCFRGRTKLLHFATHNTPGDTASSGKNWLGTPSGR